jgi:hypothetical protein
MKRLLLAALVGTFSACRKAPAAEKDLVPTVAVVAGQRLIDFDEQHGKFRCRVPGDWKAMEEHGTGGPLLMMFGTTDGPLRGKISMAVDQYDGVKGNIKSPQDYWEGLRISDQKPSPLETRKLDDGRTVYALHRLKARHPPDSWKVLYMEREDVVLIPNGKGFFELSHDAPADAYEQTLPLFDAFVRSFQPKG